MPDVMTRTGLILEPSQAKGETTLTVMRGDNGVLFRMMDVTYGKPTPLGDIVVTWQKLDQLIAKLVEFRDASLPKHHYVDIDVGKLFGKLSNTGG